MKLHTVVRSTATGNPLITPSKSNRQVFTIRVPAEGVIHRFAVASEDQNVVRFDAQLFDTEPAEDSVVDETLYAITPSVSATSGGAAIRGVQYAYSNTHKRTISGTDLYLVITADSDINKDVKFAVCLVIEVSGAKL